jgi:hypothetical protein
MKESARRESKLVKSLARPLMMVKVMAMESSLGHS